MARCYRGTCPTQQQFQLSSQIHLSLTLAKTLWSHWVAQAKKRSYRSGGPGVVTLTGFKPPFYVNGSNLFKFLLPIKIDLTYNSEKSKA